MGYQLPAMPDFLRASIDVLLGIGLLFGGGELFVQGSVALALVFGIPQLVIGLTVVVLGASALVLPLRVESRLVRRDIPLLIAISAAVWGMASAGRMTWQAGIALLVGLMINTVWEIRTAREQPDVSVDAEPEVDANAGQGGWTLAVIKLIAGIAVLTIGSRVLVSGAITAATLLGVSEAVMK